MGCHRRVRGQVLGFQRRPDAILRLKAQMALGPLFQVIHVTDAFVDVLSEPWVVLSRQLDWRDDFPGLVGRVGTADCGEVLTVDVPG